MDKSASKKLRKSTTRRRSVTKRSTKRSVNRKSTTRRRSVTKRSTIRRSIKKSKGLTSVKNDHKELFIVNGKYVYNFIRKQADDPLIEYRFVQDPNDPIELYTLTIPSRNRKLEKVYKKPSVKKIQSCKGIYENDPVSMIDFKEFEKDEYNDIYIDGERCFSISSILRKIETGFAAFDPETRRVLPLYPSDFSNQPLPPHVFRSIVKTALDREINVKAEYPILFIFYEDGTNLLEAIYAYINQYRELTERFMKITDHYAGVRRDLVAIQWMSDIYEKYGIPDIGYRKYVDIESTNSHNGTQIFYPAVFVSYLVNKKQLNVKKRGDDVDENTDYYWTQWKATDKNVTFRSRQIVRSFVGSKVILRR